MIDQLGFWKCVCTKTEHIDRMSKWNTENNSNKKERKNGVQYK